MSEDEKKGLHGCLVAILVAFGVVLCLAALVFGICYFNPPNLHYN